MSKSKGNAINPFELIEEYGADTIRWYFPYVSPIWTPLKFDVEGLKEVYSKFFNTLKNTYSFFALYANTDKIDPREFKVDKKDLEEIDLWLLSKYNRLVESVTASYDEYDLTKITKAVTEFVSEDLSNWYIRRNRRRFWDSDLNTSKKAVYQTTYEVLLGLAKLIAPIVPFVSEELYQSLTDEKSVHLADFPIADTSYYNDQLEEKMDLVRDIISLGRNAREEIKIKVRQPISEIILDEQNKDKIGDLIELIREELNVKRVEFAKNLSEYMDFEAKPNFKDFGKFFGPNIKEFATKLGELKSEVINSLSNGGELVMELGGKEYTITKEMIEARIKAKDGFNAANHLNNFIILNSMLTSDLIEEGIVRELISKVQQLRKNKDFDIADRITLYYDADDKFDTIVNHFNEMIKDETLSTEIVKQKLDTEDNDLNGVIVKFDVRQNK